MSTGRQPGSANRLPSRGSTPKLQLFAIGLNDQQSKDLQHAATVAQPEFDYQQADESKALAVLEQRESSEAPDLYVVHYPHGQAVRVLRRIAMVRPRRPVVAWLGDVKFDTAMDALDAGATHLLRAGADEVQIAKCLSRALRAAEQVRRHQRHLARYRTLCHQLRAARLDSRKQCDDLFADLLHAYEDLAGQVHTVTFASDYHALVRHELDLDQLVQNTVGFLVEQAGPTNAAVFLPMALSEYALAGYVQDGSWQGDPDLLLQEMADSLVPAVALKQGLVQAGGSQSLASVLGSAPAACLGQNSVLAFTAHHEGEALAVVVLFRQADRLFDADMVHCCESVQPRFAAQLAKIVSVHHRSSGQLWGDEES